MFSRSLLALAICTQAACSFDETPVDVGSTSQSATWELAPTLTPSPPRRRRRPKNGSGSSPTKPHPLIGTRHIQMFKNPDDGKRATELSRHIPADAYHAAAHGLAGKMEEVDTPHFVKSITDNVVKQGGVKTVVLEVCDAAIPGTGTAVGKQVFDSLVAAQGKDAPTVLAPNGVHGSDIDDATGKPKILVANDHLEPLSPADSFTAYDHDHPKGRPAKPEEVTAAFGPGSFFTPEPRGGYGTPPPNDSSNTPPAK